jgi:polysaccharide export outer membrane protein
MDSLQDFIGKNREGVRKRVVSRSLKKRLHLLLLLLSLSLHIACATGEKPNVTNLNLLEASSGNQQSIKTPRISELTLGPGDEVEINVYRQSDLNRKIQIPPDGRIFYPLIGEIQAVGISVNRLRDAITEGLSKYVKDPQVSVNVTALKSEKVFVLGEVQRPGVFTLESRLSAVEAVTAAGGFTPDAKWTDVLLIRNRQEKMQLVASLNLKSALKEGNSTQNVSLENGDVLYIPSIAIADVARFFQHLENILRPVILITSGTVVLAR